MKLCCRVPHVSLLFYCCRDLMDCQGQEVTEDLRESLVFLGGLGHKETEAYLDQPEYPDRKVLKVYED